MYMKLLAECVAQDSMNIILLLSLLSSLLSLKADFKIVVVICPKTFYHFSVIIAIV